MSVFLPVYLEFAKLSERKFGGFLVFIYKNKGVPKITCNNRSRFTEIRSYYIFFDICKYFM